MSEPKKTTGVRIFIMTVDAETNQLLKTQEENPNTGKRTEVEVEARQQAAEAFHSFAPAPAQGLPPGFIPSVVIYVGGSAASAGSGVSALGGIIPVVPHLPPPPKPQVTTVVTPKPTPTPTTPKPTKLRKEPETSTVIGMGKRKPPKV